MSDNDYSIRVDDLILFFKDKNETIVNRLISRQIYTAKELKIPKGNIKEYWKDAVLSEPGIGPDGEHYHVANLAKLVMQDSPELATHKNPVALPPGTGAADLAPEDIVVIPPESPDEYFRVPRDIYENETICPALPEREIPDLEFMATEEGVVFANIPKITPQGCSCVLLSLIGLRSEMLGDPGRTKTQYAKHVQNVMRAKHKPRNGNT
jgi:hypothetical protein